MVTRSVSMTVVFTVVICAMMSTKAEAFGCHGYCNAGWYACGPACYGASNCGLGWGACGGAWWMGQAYTGCPRYVYGCAPRVRHCHLFGHKWCRRAMCCGSSCGCSSCDGGCSGCSDGSCGGGTTSASYDASYDPSDAVVESHITSEHVSPSVEATPENVPNDRSANIHQSAFRLTSSTQADGSAAFQKGITVFRQGKMKEALGNFEAAATAEPNNALYQYHRALAMFDLAGADAAQDALKKAVELEKTEPVKNWGKRMERVQGKGRVWIETARRSAGLVR